MLPNPQEEQLPPALPHSSAKQERGSQGGASSGQREPVSGGRGAQGRFLFYCAATPLVLAALHKVFTEREEASANNMFLHL